MRKNPELEEREAELLEEIRQLRRDLADVKAERKELREQVRLTDQITDLKKQLVDLEIQKAKVTEDHDRETRDVKHMVGLERKRSTFEVEQAKRETVVTVREENLAADRKRFEDQMEFTTSRFEKEVGYLKDLISEALERLPKVTVNQSGRPARTEDDD